MSRRPFRLPAEGRPFLELASLGRTGPTGQWLSAAQIEQIRRTVRRTPEVMVKVTGGGTKTGAVGAHFDYIGRRGKLEIETDEGERITGKDAQRVVLAEWHLDLSAGQYRGPRMGGPWPEPQGSSTASFSRCRRRRRQRGCWPQPGCSPGEKFGAQHRYAMVLHTDQAHSHVHLVVKAEGERGKRPYIDKPMLREWRDDFARMMREQGIAANATPRVIRGRNKGKAHEGIFRARRHGESYAFREKVMAMATQLNRNGYFGEPAHAERDVSITLRHLVVRIYRGMNGRHLYGDLLC